tara:strand:+ start:149 stop:490 length:342 start_codon:yes stop_codon:yes gene_type:complete
MSFNKLNYSDGDVIFEEGDSANQVYMIESGSVKIINRKFNHEIAVLSKGDTFGEQSLIAGGIRSASAVSIGKTNCLEITAKGLQDLLSKQGGIATVALEALLLQLSMHNSMDR